MARPAAAKPAWALLAAGLAVLSAALPAVRLTAQSTESFNAARAKMVEEQLVERDITDRKLLRVMGSVPRHMFVPPEMRARAYDDEPLQISKELSIHQPYVVALMTSQLGISSGSRVLEIGTGTGYHSAVLSELAAEVYTIEIDPEVSRQARDNLERFGAHNVHLRVGDGYEGWPQEAPFDAIILTTAAPRVPQPLVDQLRRGGVMVIPVGTVIQELTVLTKTEDGQIRKETTVPVKLPRMSGEVQNKRVRP
jgi:protein-L-isoaspartate(D-aspartate) O-methyltransferase